MKLYILSLCLLFLSVSGYCQWKQTSGPPGGGVTAITANSQYIFVVVDDRGVYRTPKDSTAWQEVNNGLTNFSIHTLGTMANLIFVGTTNGIFRSDDNGDTWLNQTASTEITYSFAADQNEIYAGSSPYIMHSIDSGLTWTKLDSSGSSYHNDLLIRGDDVYSANGQFFYNPCEAVQVSHDHGDTWLPFANGLESQGAISLAIIDDYIFAGTTSHGVYRSTFTNPIWSPSSAGIGNWIDDMVVIDTTLIALTSSGLFASSDYGDTWAPWGVIPSDFYSKSIFLMDTLLLIGINADGLYETTQGNVFISLGPPKAHVIATEANDSVVICIINNNEMFRTNDNGSTWFNLINYPGYPLSPYTESMLLNGNDLFFVSEGGCFYSDDLGDHWYPRNSGLGNDLECKVIYKGNDALYLATVKNLYRSIDNGNSWQKLFNPLHPSSFSMSSIYENDNYLFVCDGLNSMFRSADFGQSWDTLMIYPEPPFGPLKINACGNRLFAVGWVDYGYDSRVFFSDDQGTSWSEVPDSSGLITTSAFRMFATGDSIIVTTSDEGVFESFDKGFHWNLINEGLTDDDVYDLSIGGNYLFAGTDGSSVWLRPMNEIFNSVPGEIEPFTSINIFPNPTSGQLSVTWQPASTAVTIQLFDLLGRKINSEKVKTYPGQRQTLHLDGWIHQLPEGIYTLMLQDGMNHECCSIVKVGE